MVGGGIGGGTGYEHRKVREEEVLTEGSNSLLQMFANPLLSPAATLCGPATRLRIQGTHGPHQLIHSGPLYLTLARLIRLAPSALPP
jgi:hypothetical protein